MRIAVDAMGGDHAPHAIIEGALLALQEFKDIDIVLVGDKDQIQPFIENSPASSRLEIVHTTDVIGTDEEPVKAVRKKKDSSLVKVTQMVKDKEADACISAGNTGAYMTAGLLVTGRIKGIERPALTAFMPTITGRIALTLDVGANLDAKPEHLLQYSKMGSIYAENVMGYENPTVGLLNVGTEDTKGNDLVKKTFLLLKESSVNFIGNIEARDVPLGVADIVISEGFAGNVMLKATEGTAEAVFRMLKEELTKNISSKLAAAVLRPGLKRIKAKMDYSEYGGAILLGLDGGCIKAHGSSGSLAIKNAIRQARKLIKEDVVGLIKSEVQKESDAE
jgi:glycerol-3-phosphate acyltransferase PlsX